MIENVKKTVGPIYTVKSDRQNFCLVYDERRTWNRIQHTLLKPYTTNVCLTHNVKCSKGKGKGKM